MSVLKSVRRGVVVGIGTSTGVLTLALVCLVCRNWEWLMSPAHEPMGDIAANLLQVQYARDGRELLGPYSRFGFHHPGPVSFYLWSLGDQLVRFLPTFLIRVQFTQLVLNMTLIALAARTLARSLPGSGVGFTIAALLGLTLGQGGSHHGWLSIWGPRVVIGPMFLFLVASGATLAGSFRRAPLVAVAGVLMVHNQLGTAPVIAPICVLLLGRLIMDLRRGSAPWMALFLGIWSIGALPLLVEEFTHDPGNLSLISNFVRENSGASHSVMEALRAIGWALFAPVSVAAHLLDAPLPRPPFVAMAVWSGALLTGGVAAARVASGCWRAVMILSLLTIGLTTVSATRVPGPLHPYLFLFLRAPTMILLLAVLWVSSVSVLRSTTRIRGSQLATAAFLVFVIARPLPIPAAATLSPIVEDIANATSSRTLEVSLSDEGPARQLWPQLTGLVVQLREAGWVVHTPPAWDLLVRAGSRGPRISTVPILHLLPHEELTEDFRGWRTPSFGVVLLERAEPRSTVETVAAWELEQFPEIGHAEVILAGDRRLVFEGWHALETTYLWSEGQRASVRFRCQPGSGIELAGGVVGTGVVEFLLNGTPIGSAKLVGFGPHDIRLSVPISAWNPDSIQTLTVVSPDARKASRASSRTLGFQLTSLTVWP